MPIAGTTPNITVVSSSVRGTKSISKFDMVKSFWQLPRDVASQELMSFMTEDTVYTPNWVAQGAMVSAIDFQMQMQDVMALMLQRNDLVCVDDVIIFAPSVEEFLQALKEFFIILRDRRLKMSAAKSSLFQLYVAELQYFVCASNWLHDSLPDYARVVAPLQERLGMEGNKNGLNVAVILTENEVISYNEVKTLIKASVPLEFPSSTLELVVMTGPLLTGWSMMVTEVRVWLPVDKQ
ncbi:hypothetical protein PR001_g26475 [Phytophthora rubi]|nr:hypothetical protein PR001_g26475 [Phytophthora rubi]